MRVLVGCETSGRVREAFRKRGHDAWSCDLLPSDDNSPFHYQCDVRGVLGGGWDLLIGFPDCTYVCGSGLHWNNRGRGWEKTEEAIKFFKFLWTQPIKRIALENPVGCLSTRVCKPSQIIQPWYFGDDASKKTCLWLKNLPLLKDTNRLPGDHLTRRANQTASGQNKLGPSKDRWKERSITYQGIAYAMADQWGDESKLPHILFDI